MSKDYSKLFEPLKIGKVEIPNKYSMAPMGPVGFATEEGAFNENGIEYYVERAKGGVGLIITGICNVENEIEPLKRPTIPCVTMSPFHFIQSASILTERVHAYGSKIFLQLTAGFGRAGIPNLIAGEAVAPSEQENRWDPKVIHRALKVSEIETYIRKFRESAVIAEQAGFDGVEIHAVHEGYLLDQFTIKFYNKRKDEYGGSLENRLRFPLEIVKGIKEDCGEDFPVSLRYSLKSMIKGLRQGALPMEEFKELGRDYEEGLKAAKILVKGGYDALNMDVGTYDSWYWNHPPMYFEDGLYRKFGKMLKEAVDVPVILAGRMDDPDIALSALENKEADGISLGRPLLADSEIVRKIRVNKFNKVRPCLSCHEGCMGRIAKVGLISCAVNPACGRERTYGIEEAKVKKRILVIGGGVSGLEFARVSALRGHRVDLYERKKTLGGNLVPGGMPEFKKNDRKLVKWYEEELREKGVRVFLNSKIKKENINKDNYDVVVIATGSKPKVLDVLGIDKEKVYTADKILLDKDLAKGKITLVGGGLVGCETALHLAKMGKEVTILEVSKEILEGGRSLPFMNYDMLKDLLNFYKVSIKTESSLEEVKERSIVYKNKEGKLEEIENDTLVLAVGYKPKRKLYDELKMEFSDIYLLGDAREVHNIMYAIWDAYEVARSI